eukprot:8822272-Alexandrium_andersonii.AAC.1
MLIGLRQFAKLLGIVAQPNQVVANVRKPHAFGMDEDLQVQRRMSDKPNEVATPSQLEDRSHVGDSSLLPDLGVGE